MSIFVEFWTGNAPGEFEDLLVSVAGEQVRPMLPELLNEKEKISVVKKNGHTLIPNLFQFKNSELFSWGYSGISSNRGGGSFFKEDEQVCTRSEHFNPEGLILSSESYF